MFVYTVVDSSKCIALNVLRSTGRPSITVIINTVVCLLVMLPTGYYWAVLCGYGLVGLWAGMSLAWLCATIFFCVIVVRTDWGDPSLVLGGHNDADNSKIAKPVDHSILLKEVELVTQ
jgi:Na+-driven multidrug efflux pump